jgi:DNA-binding MarR family transcriptional regulator
MIDGRYNMGISYYLFCSPIIGLVMNASTGLIAANRCNNTALRKASRRLSQTYDEIVAPSGLKSTQLSVLFEIDRSNDGPTTMKDLAAALVMDRSTLGQNLRPLEREGLVVMVNNPDDGRSKLVKLTVKGKKKVVSAAALWNIAQNEFEQKFGEENAAALRTILLSIAADNNPRSKTKSSMSCTP